MRAHPGKLVAPRVVGCSFHRLSLPRTEQARLRSKRLRLPGGMTISTISRRRLVHNAGWSPETGMNRGKRARPGMLLAQSLVAGRNATARPAPGFRKRGTS
jgi:hypothetical protein